MPLNLNREYRDMVLEVVVGDVEEDEAPKEERKLVAGYATTFNDPYTLFEDGNTVIREQVNPGAFDNADMEDVIMQYNHEGRVFARVSNETLTVRPDEKGLFIEADLGGTDIGRELYQEIRGGYTDKMSFGFIVAADHWDQEEADGKTIATRTIEGIKKVFDVSAVSIPANPGTEISIRKLADGVIEQIQAERLEAEKLELERMRAEVRAKAVLGGKNE